MSTQALAPPRIASRQLLRQAGYYFVIALPIAIYVLAGHVVWKQQLGNVDVNWSTGRWLLQSLMLIPFAWGWITMAGLLAFGAPADRKAAPDWQWDPESLLIIAYVSRGNCPQTLRTATSRSQAVLDRLGVRYEIETVTDIAVPPAERLSETGGRLHYCLVPRDYRTSRHTRYKARALQYLLEQRTHRLKGREDVENIWVLHLDEESFVTEETITAIGEFLARHDLRTTRGAIGQGEILYNSCRYGCAPLIESLDAARTGEDLGRFRVQFGAWHRPVFGMHGSFVLTPARIERDISWDVGGLGSITEDACFALVAMDRGIPFDWVHGFIREQSPFSLRDLVEQRRRWFCGLSHVARDAQLKRSTTLALRVWLFLWQFSWLSVPVSAVYAWQALHGYTPAAPYEAMLMGAVCGGCFSATFLVGAYRNVLHSELPLSRRLFNLAFTFVACLLLLPLIVEGAAVLYATFRPVRHFYIVAKDQPANVAAPAPVLASLLSAEIGALDAAGADPGGLEVAT